jgi:hypothetical protein
MASILYVYFVLISTPGTSGDHKQTRHWPETTKWAGTSLADMTRLSDIAATTYLGGLSSLEARRQSCQPIRMSIFLSRAEVHRQVIVLDSVSLALKKAGRHMVGGAPRSVFRSKVGLPLRTVFSHDADVTGCS